MPNEWETFHGLDPNDATDAAKDFDQDGLTNLEEYQAGTDPTDATSVFTTALVLKGTNWLLRFRDTARGSYTVEACDAMRSSSWNAITNLPALDSRIMFSVSNVVDRGLPQRFYRVRIGN